MNRLFFLCLALASGAAQAQTFGQWFYGNTEFRSNAAWVLGRSMQGGIDTLTADCSPQGAMFTFEPMQSLPTDQEGDVFFNFPGKSLRMRAQFETAVAEPGWTGPLTAELAEQLSRHSSVTVAAPHNGLTEFRLRGSRAMLSNVLAECGPGQLPAAQARLSRDFVFGKIAQACKGSYAPDPGAVVESDLDGDGAFDYIIHWGMIQCTAPSYVGMRRGAGFCGAAMCTSDVWTSSTFTPSGFAQGILNVGLEVWPDGGPYPMRSTALRQTCPNGTCIENWGWTGTKFAPVE
ncbi:hypothetical protein E4Z66_07635 [Aliishimia ponticola]|uniref:Uncharacterized protein n=1 Tax=Aliishimia ponticola TaxID=2499833 RepID=A0A4S4NF90_9RHOB|nr:hypothetical protein [Aliishimia ponticola]THH36808.1 hypothetical protein E4Z66_07635 [Aliishimia ponticola]